MLNNSPDLLYYIRFVMRRLYLIAILWRKNFFRVLSSSISLFFIILILIFFIAVVQPLKNKLLKKIQTGLPSEVLKIKKKEISDLQDPFLLFKDKFDIGYGMSRQELRKIARWKEVTRIQYSQIFQAPVLASVRHPVLQKVGGAIRFDILIQGVSTSLIKPFYRCKRPFKAITKKKVIQTEQGKRTITNTVIPIVVPRMYLDLLALWLSLNGLSTPDIEAMHGFEFDMNLGTSLLRPKNSYKKQKVTAKICGFMPEGIVSVVGTPLPWVRRYHKRNQMKSASNSYDQAFITIKDVRNIHIVQKKLKRMNIITVTQAKQYSSLFSILKKIDYFFGAFLSVLLLLSMLSLTNTFVVMTMKKQNEFGLYLVFGSSPFAIASFMFVEGASWGLLYSILSLMGADYLFQYLQANPLLLSYISDFAFINFTISTKLKTLLIVGTTLYTGLCASVPVALIMYKNPLALLKKME